MMTLKNTYKDYREQLDNKVALGFVCIDRT